jgi:hypothetical protein
MRNCNEPKPYRQKHNAGLRRITEEDIAADRKTGEDTATGHSVEHGLKTKCTPIGHKARKGSTFQDAGTTGKNTESRQN